MKITFNSLLCVMSLYEKKLIELMGIDAYRSFAQKCESEGYREGIKLMRREFNAKDNRRNCTE